MNSNLTRHTAVSRYKADRRKCCSAGRALRGQLFHWAVAQL